MKDKCAGSGELPKYTTEEGHGVCPGCPSDRKLRKDGRLKAHKPSPNYNRIVADLLRTGRR